MILQPIGTQDFKFGNKTVKLPQFDKKDLNNLISKMENIWEGKSRTLPGNSVTIFFKINSYNYGLKFWSLYDFFMKYTPQITIFFVTKEVWEKI